MDLSLIHISPDEAVKLLAKTGCKVAVITLGAKGLVGCAGNDFFSLPAFSGLDIVDTPGAGDVFHGAFASAYLMGRCVSETVSRCCT